MSHLAIMLVLASAVLHAGWNAAGKRRKPSPAFFVLALGSGMLAMSPLMMLYRNIIAALPIEIWALILLSGACQAIYYTMLAAAYRHGDMSLAYPLTRSTTVLFVAGAAVVSKISVPFSGPYVAGLAFIMGGSLILPLRTSTDFHIRRYLSKSCLFAILAAAGTSGCMLADQQVLNVLDGSPMLAISHLDQLLLYAPLQSCSALLWLGAWTLLNSELRLELGRLLREQKQQAALVGLGMYASYGLLLASTPYVTDFSYSVALRQVSIPVGTAIGILLLKEPRYVLKSVGAAAITAGVVLVVLA